MKSLVAPAKPGEKEYNQLVQELTQHFDPAPSEIVRRYRFNTRVRRKGESVAAYVSELRGLAQFCNYGDSLQTMLRDRLVCGINDESIQRRLLAETALTFKKALELAQGMETVAKNVREMQNHAVSKKTFVCYRSDVVKVATVQSTVHFVLPNVISVGNLGISKRCVSLKDPVNGQPITDPASKADILNQHFKSVFTTEDRSNIPDKGSSHYPSIADFRITSEGVYRVLSNCNPHKSPGPDAIILMH